jgi:hypothetical protein
MSENEKSLELIREHAEASLAVEYTSDGYRVTSQCLYPSNGRVRVFVRLGRETAIVSDDGEAVGEALAAGVQLKDPDKVLRHLVNPYGLKITNGVILTPTLPLSALAASIVLVANASQECASWLYSHQRIRKRRDIRPLLHSYLRNKFDHRLANGSLVGASNKRHRFQNLIQLEGGRKIIVDPVAHDPSSINARLVANLDIRSMKDPLLIQRIVYDDIEEWSAADLNLLQVGATVVPFSRVPDVIERVVANVDQSQHS